MQNEGGNSFQNPYKTKTDMKMSRKETLRKTNIKKEVIPIEKMCVAIEEGKDDKIKARNFGCSSTIERLEERPDEVIGAKVELGKEEENASTLNSKFRANAKIAKRAHYCT